jgi:Putative ATP-binding cassette
MSPRRLADGIGLGWMLWRAQLTMFINQTVRSRKPGRLVAVIAGGVVLLVLWGWEGIVTALALAASHRISFNIDLPRLFSLAFFAYTGVLIFSSLVFSLNALLLNPDLDLLLSSPRPVETVLAGRMVVQFLRLLLLSLLFTFPALVVLSVAAGNPLILVGFAALYVVYPVFSVVLISLATLFLVRFIPAGRGKEIVTVLSLVLALGINLVNFLFNPALRDSGFRPRRGTPASLPDLPLASSPWLPSGWAGRSAAGILTGHWLVALEWGLILVAASAVLFAVGAHLSGRLYLAGWINAVPPRRRHGGVTRSPGSVRAIPLLDPVVSSIVIKDWRMRTRDLAQLARFAMPVIFLFVLFGFRSSRLLSSVQSLGNGPVAAMLGLLPSWILLLSLSSALGLTAVSLEGKNIWIYAASPNSVLRMLQAKCWSAALPTVAAVTLAAVVTEAVIRPGWLWAVTATALAVVQAVAITALMVAIGAVFARFDWTDVRRMLHPAAGLLGIIGFFLVIGTSALLMAIALALATAAHFPLATTWLASLTFSAGGAIAAAALALLLSASRLQRLELG